MGKLRKVVGVSLAVALVAALGAYLLLPKPTAETISVQQPTPPSGGSGSTNTGTGSSTTPSTPPPDVRPPKLHGQNSHGPKHPVCLSSNEHVQGVAQYQGANWYRGQCTPSPGANAQGQANANANGQAQVTGQFNIRYPH